MATKTIKVLLRPYKGLAEQFTQVANSMFYYIDDQYAFRVYFYLCMLYNRNFDYAFPTIRGIAKDCKMSTKKAQWCIDWLTKMKYIEKKSVKSNGKYPNNIYYIRYIDNRDVIEKIIEEDEEIYTEIEVEIEIDA